MTTENNFIDFIFNESGCRAHRRFWLISDLQQSRYDLAEKYLACAMADMRDMAPALSGICYLGDASAGTDAAEIDRMIKMQVAELETLHVPVYYTIGNHEVEYYLYCKKQGHALPAVMPFYEEIKNRPLWHTVSSQEDFWFAEDQGEFVMLFFSAHLDKQGNWTGYHEMIPDAGTGYPYAQEAWCRVRDQFANLGKPVFTFAHWAFPGGNRPSDLLGQMLPLPDNYRAHFYGHAHIGDVAFAKPNLYRQVSTVDNHQALQFDVASLDHWRGTTVRSAFFDYYGDGQYGVFFRDHINRRWEQVVVSAHDAKTSAIPERFQVQG